MSAPVGFERRLEWDRDTRGRSDNFSLGSAANLDLRVSGYAIRSIGVDNSTPFWIHCPDQIGAFAWVAPWALGAVLPCPLIGSGPVRLTSRDVPATFPANPATALMASITAYEAALPPSPGYPAPPATQLVPIGPEWALVSAPAAGNQATTTQAAAAGIRHVCTSFSFSFSSRQAVAASDIAIILRDGASGVGTVLDQFSFSFPAAIVAPFAFGLSGLRIPGSDNTAMTIEFNAGVALLNETVSMTGYDGIG